MVLHAANAENNKEHKSNRREAWEQPYPPVPTLALAYPLSFSLLYCRSLSLCCCSWTPFSCLSRTVPFFALTLSLVCVRGLLCLFGWWGFSSSSFIVVAVWSRRQNYAQRCHLVTLALRLQCNTITRCQSEIVNHKSQLT